MAEFNPAKFIREVRHEAGKVTWPTRRETSISTLMVLALATLAAIFFVLADMLISAGVRMIIGI
ncbi:MAG: preprotein translocase subunit SecE [Rickettsiales bacterium]|jgi:preprotein translocase subunit SecE|nr:preprotein translocase subunit SecE [Rickettsiales bacterium]